MSAADAPTPLTPRPTPDVRACRHRLLISLSHERFERQLRKMNPGSIAARTGSHPIRILCLILLPIALAAGLLAGVPSRAAADGSPAGAGNSGSADRARVLDLWSSGGPEVRAAAEAALTGGDDDVTNFLAKSAWSAEFQDERVSAAQLASVGGRNLQDAAVKALGGSEHDLRAFLSSGWQDPYFQDQRVKVAQIIDAGGPEVKKAGQAALNGTADDIRAFL
ncbi:ALF repeat-containing protein, partial [Streptomyces sp. NPDC002076]